MLPSEIDVLIIAPTGPEFAVVANILTSPKLLPTVYPAKKGKIGPHTVLCSSSGTGQEGAASVITSLAAQWTPKYLFLVGIAGGFTKHQIHRGDVIVANVIHSFDYGTVEHGGFTRKPDKDAYCDDGLMQWATSIDTMNDVEWKRVREQRPDGKQPFDFKVHMNCYVASSNKIIDDPTYSYYNELAVQYPEIGAVEMEGIGAGAAVRLIQSDRSLRFLMIRGISDEPDGDSGWEKRHEWKRYASATAAAFAKQLIEALPPSKPQSELDDPEFEEAKQLFDQGRYSAALPGFISVVRRHRASSEARYYLVLSALSEVRPNLLRSERVMEIDRHLKEALAGAAAGNDAHIRYLWAIVRHDCYRLNGFSEPQPTSKDLLAGNVRLDALRAREIASAITAPGNPIWESIAGSKAAHR